VNCPLAVAHPAMTGSICAVWIADGAVPGPALNWEVALAPLAHVLQCRGTECSCQLCPATRPAPTQRPPLPQVHRPRQLPAVLCGGQVRRLHLGGGGELHHMYPFIRTVRNLNCMLCLPFGACLCCSLQCLARLARQALHSISSTLCPLMDHPFLNSQQPAQAMARLLVYFDF
jgi:hypothetical protein